MTSSTRLSAEGLQQPALFRSGGRIFDKLDHSALLINDPSCFADCVELLGEVYFVFSTKYPDELMV